MTHTSGCLSIIEKTTKRLAYPLAALTARLGGPSLASEAAKWGSVQERDLPHRRGLRFRVHHDLVPHVEPHGCVVRVPHAALDVHPGVAGHRPPALHLADVLRQGRVLRDREAVRVAAVHAHRFAAHAEQELAPVRLTAAPADRLVL